MTTHDSGVAAPLKTWQHDETGRITEAAECPGPRWAEVPAGVMAVGEPSRECNCTRPPCKVGKTVTNHAPWCAAVAGVKASGLPVWVDGLRDFMERNGKTTEEVGNVLVAAGFATRGVEGEKS